MDNTVKLSDSVKKVTLSGNEIILALDGRNISIPLSVLKEFLGVTAVSGIGGVVQDESYTPGQGSSQSPFIYFAAPGTYPGFDGAVVESPLAVIKWDGSSAEVMEVPVPPAENKIPGWDPEEPGPRVQDDQRIHNGQIWSVVVPSTTQEPGTGTDWVKVIDKVSNSEVGIEVIEAGTNIISELVDSDFNDTSLWGVGYFSVLGDINDEGTSTPWRYSKKYYPATEGEYRGQLKISGNAAIIAYDFNKNFIAGLLNPSGSASSIPFIFPEGTRYVRVSCSSDLFSSSLIELNLVEQKKVYTDQYFTTPAYVQTKSTEAAISELEKFGLKPVPEGTNFLAELTGSDVLNTDLWNLGMLRDNGSILMQEGIYHSRKYYKLYPVKYNVISKISGNSKILLYDSDRNIVQVISSSNSVIDNSVLRADSIRITFDNRTEGVDTDIIRLTNIDTVYRGVTSVETENIVSENNTSGAVNGFAVVNYTKDIFKSTNHSKSRYPVVSFIADDGRAAEEWYISVMESFGVRSTFAYPTDRLYDSSGNSLSRERIVELYKNGHDIASHTHTHTNLKTGGMTPEQIDADLFRSKVELLNLGIDANMFVAPQGGRDAEIDKIIRKYFDTDFITGIPVGKISNPPPIDSYFITRQSFDANANGVSTLQDCKDAVDYAIANKEWLVFAIHPSYTEYSASANPDGWETRRGELSLLIEYIQSLNVPILTAKNAYEIWKNPIQIGNVRLDEKYYALGMDGSEDGDFFL